MDDIQEGRDAAAGDAADAADNDHQQGLIGHGRLEGGGLHRGLEHGQQRAAHAREEARDDECVHLVAEEVDAHGLGGHFVVADGLEGAAVGGVDQKDDESDRQDRDQEGEEGGQLDIERAEAQIDVGEGGVFAQQV